MSDYNPNFYNRRSIRLKGYDYSRCGLYFITICTQNRECLFGEIRTVGEDVGAGLRACPDTSLSIQPSPGDHEGSPLRELALNLAGQMIEKWYCELENKYPNIRCHEMVVMPNHFHCIIEILDAVVPGWAAHVGAPLRGHPDDNNDLRYGPHNKKYNPVIGNIVGWLKTMTTNEYIREAKNNGWKRFDGKLWQRNYWEHIIRDDDSYNEIAGYITENPTKWKIDQLNPDQKP